MPIPTAPVALDASLHLLADHLLDALRADEIEPSVLTVGGVDADGFCLNIRPLDGAHPTDLLLGLTCPPEVHAIGLAVRGWARRHPHLSGGHSAPHRVRIVTLVSRTGELAHRIHHEVPMPPPSDEAPSGEQIDLMRRCLGLPTDPPPVDAGVFWTMAWLARVAACPVPITSAATLLDLHPAFDALDGAPHGPAGLRAVQEFLDIKTWTELRTEVTTDGHPNGLIGAADADWLDDGAFARFVLARLPSLGQLRADACANLPAGTARRLTGLMDRLGVPDQVWPHDPR